MAFLDLFRTEKRSITNVTPFIFGTGGTQLLPNNLVTADLALRNSDLYSVTSLVSADLAGSKFQGNAKVVDVLNKPTPLTSRYNFWQTMYLALMLTGNAFAVIQKDPRGVLTGIKYVPSSAVTLDLTGGKLTYIITSVGDWEGGHFDSQDILHFKIMAYGSDVSGLIGHSPLESLASEYQQQEAVKQLSLNVLTKSVNPTSLLKVPFVTLSAEAKENVRAEIEKAQSGPNAGRPMVLDNSVTYETLDINANVAQLITTDAYQREQMSKVFGVPTSFLNGNSDAQSSLEMINAQYINALNRYIEPIVSELQLKLDESINLSIADVADYLGTNLKQDVLNYVDKGLLSPIEGRKILIDKGLIQL